MAADKIVVSEEAMNTAITRYDNARNTLADAFNKMEEAKDHLDRCWKGPSWLAYLTKWETLYGNIRKTDLAMERAISALREATGIFNSTEETNTGAAQKLEQAEAPKIFM